MLRAVAVLALAACAPAHPAAPAAGASCAAVADHLVALAERDNAARASPSLATGIRGEAVRQCTDTPWSAARRDCLLAARTQDQTLACPGSEHPDREQELDQADQRDHGGRGDRGLP